IDPVSHGMNIAVLCCLKVINFPIRLFFKCCFQHTHEWSQAYTTAHKNEWPCVFLIQYEVPGWCADRDSIPLFNLTMQIVGYNSCRQITDRVFPLHTNSVVPLIWCYRHAVLTQMVMWFSL